MAMLSTLVLCLSIQYLYIYSGMQTEAVRLETQPKPSLFVTQTEFGLSLSRCLRLSGEGAALPQASWQDRRHQNQ